MMSGTVADSGGDARYFEQIESRFAQLRGTPLLLSPRDWSLVASWRRQDIPLRVVLEALESVFRGRQQAAGSAKPRPVLSLGYCRHAVEEAFETWRESQIGAPSGAATPEQVVPGPQDAAGCLRSWAEDLKSAGDSKILEACVFRKAASVLGELADELLSAEPPSLSATEEKLEIAEDDLLDGLLEAMDSGERQAMETEVENELEPLRGRLTARAFASTLRGHLRSRVRAVRGLPHLTLYGI